MLEWFKNAIAIYKWGSCVVPYIEDPHDVDYLVIYEKEDDLVDVYIPSQTEIGIHFFVICLEDLKTKNYLKFNILNKDLLKRRWKSLYELSCAPCQLVMFHWTSWVEGKKLNLKQYFNILQDADCHKALYNALLTSTEVLMNTYKKTGGWSKEWYYIYLAYCIFVDRTYELPNYQIANLNKFHDLNATQEDYLRFYHLIDRLGYYNLN